MANDTDPDTKKKRERYAPPLASFDPRMMQVLVDAAKPNAEPWVREATSDAEKLRKLYQLRLRFNQLRWRMRAENHPLTSVVYSVAISFSTPKRGELGHGTDGVLKIHRHDERFDDIFTEKDDVKTPPALSPPVSSNDEDEDELDAFSDLAPGSIDQL